MITPSGCGDAKPSYSCAWDASLASIFPHVVLRVAFSGLQTYVLPGSPQGLDSNPRLVLSMPHCLVEDSSLPQILFPIHCFKGSPLIEVDNLEKASMLFCTLAYFMLVHE